MKRFLSATGRSAVVLLILWLLSGSGLAQRHGRGPVVGHHSPAMDTIDVSGKGLRRLRLTREELKAMARNKISLGDQTDSVQKYEGVLLIELLKKAGLATSNQNSRAIAQSVIKATGRDQFCAVFSLYEVMHSPDVLVADTLNGAPLSTGQGPVMLVAGNDQDQGRAVVGLSSITLAVVK
jgi:hypothetical protein